MLAQDETPYVVVVGPPVMARRLAARLPEPPFAVLGELFAPGRIDLGSNRASLGGLRRTDMAIRDAHPALWLVRARERGRTMHGGEGVPVIPWSPADRGELLASMVRDPASLVVVLPPFSGDPSRDRAALTRACLGPVRRRTASLPLGVPAAAMARAAFEAGGGAPGPDIALWMVGGLSPPPTRGIPLLPPPGFPRTGFPEWFATGAPLPPPDLVLPWGGDRAPESRDRRRRALAAGIATCRFREAAWFPALAGALTAAAEDAELDAGPEGETDNRVPDLRAAAEAALPEPADGCR